MHQGTPADMAREPASVPIIGVSHRHISLEQQSLASRTLYGKPGEMFNGKKTAYADGYRYAEIGHQRHHDCRNQSHRNGAKACSIPLMTAYCSMSDIGEAWLKDRKGSKAPVHRQAVSGSQFREISATIFVFVKILIPRCNKDWKNLHFFQIGLNTNNFPVASSIGSARLLAHSGECPALPKAASPRLRQSH